MLLSARLFFHFLRDTLVVLSAHDLSVIKSDRLLFDKVNFSVEQGGLLYVKGPNGAGKTSLLRVLCGLLDSETGKVSFKQQDILTQRSEFHHQLVYFGHKAGLNLRLSAIENLTFWCQQHEQSVSVEQIYQTLAQLQLVGLEDVPVGHLSAGQQRRVALTRLWFKTSATLWVLDEPLTALDTHGISLLIHKIASFLHSGGAVVMTSHQDLELDYPTQELVLEYRI
jgi:heme exporter protein A